MMGPKIDDTRGLTIISTHQHHPNAIRIAAHLVLAGSRPHVLQVAVTLSQTVEGVIALTTGTNEAAQSVGLVLAGVAAVLVNLANGELDGGVVVGLDDAVGGAALAGHVAVGRETMLVVLDISWILRMFRSSPVLPCLCYVSQRPQTRCTGEI